MARKLAASKQVLEGELDEAEVQFLILLKEHPEHGLALTGLYRLKKLVRDRAGDDAVRSLLESLLEDALETSFGDDILWELYAWHYKHGQLDEAEAYLLAIRSSFPFPTGERSGDTGRKVYDADGAVAIGLIKGPAPPAETAPHKVDGISGATLTCNGVTNLVQFWLGDEGFGPYLAQHRSARGI